MQNEKEEKMQLAVYKAYAILIKLNKIEHTTDNIQKAENEFREAYLQLQEDKKYISILQNRIHTLLIISIRNSSKRQYIKILKTFFNFDATKDNAEIISNFDYKSTQSQINHFYYEINNDFSFSNVIKPIINSISIYNTQSEDVLSLITTSAKKYNYRYLYVHDIFSLWLDDYITKNNNTRRSIFDMDGVLPKIWKIYIAIMAASICKSEYLLEILEIYFLENEGDEQWLVNGLDVVPSKLKALAQINELLAFTPWKINEEEIAEINKRYNNDLNWNYNELMQAVLILIFYQKLASFCNAIGIGINTKEAHNSMKKPKSSTQINTLQSFQDKEKQELIHQIEDMNKEDDSSELDDNNEDEEDDDDEDIIGTTDTIKITKNDSPLQSHKKSSGDFSFDVLLKLYSPIFDKHCKSNAKYCDFNPHSQKYLSYLDFNWNDQGIYIVRELSKEIIECINKEIDFALNITSNSFGETSLNTTSLRKAIAFYIEKIFGIEHEDYNYANVNILLKIDLKKFIKRIATQAFIMQKKDFEYMNSLFKNEEILHVILLVLSIKERCQLTYFAKGINEIFKNFT